MKPTMYNTASGHHQVLSDVCFIHGKGPFLYDEEENRYIDFYNNACIPLGHQPLSKEIYDYPHPLNVGLYHNRFRNELLKRLARLFPEYGSFQLYSTGTSANEGMLRYAMAITGRSAFGGFHGAFHGRSKALTSITDMDTCNGERIPGYFVLPFPGFNEKTGSTILASADGTQNLASIEKIIDRQQAEHPIAGLLLEPVFSKSVVIPPKGWLKSLKENILAPRGILLLADEYLLSGRSGAWLESRRQGALPDIISFGKCFANGLPFAGIGCLKEHEHKVTEVKGSDTFGGQSLICHHVLLTLEEIEEQHLLRRGLDIEHAFLESFSDVVGRHGVVNVQARGSVLWIEYAQKSQAIEFAQRALRNRVLVSVIKNGIRLTPAMNIGTEDLTEGFRLVRKTIEEIA